MRFINFTVLDEDPHDLIEIPGKNNPESVEQCATASREKYFRILAQSAKAVNVSVVDFVTSGSNHIARSVVNVLVLLRIVFTEQTF